MAPAPRVGEAFFPLDEQLGLLAGGLTPRAEETLVRLATWMPYAQAQELLSDLVGIGVSKATARRATLSTGEAVLARDEGEVERLKQEVPQAPRGADKQQLSADGAMVHLVGGEWVEVKTLIMGEVTRNKRGEVCTQQLFTFSRLADAEHFTEASLVETHRRGLERAAAVCAVQDGAEWLQGFVDYHRADAVRILDFAHAAQYLNEIGQAVQAAGGRLPARWFEGVRHWLKHQGPERVLKHLSWLAARYPSAGVQEKLAYLGDPRGAHALPDLSGRRLAHWLGQCGKCQQGSCRSTLKRSRDALGTAQCQSHASAAQCRLQSTLERDVAGYQEATAAEPPTTARPAHPGAR
ncbi:MAG: hypothetical protein ACJ8DI_09850 [Ktedonobacteraceae bacterium]